MKKCKNNMVLRTNITENKKNKENPLAIVIGQEEIF